jgi:hypothetical protein
MSQQSKRAQVTGAVSQHDIKNCVASAFAKEDSDLTTAISVSFKERRRCIVSTHTSIVVEAASICPTVILLISTN